MCAHASPVVSTVSTSPGETVRTAVTSTGSQEPNVIGSVPSDAVTVRSIAPPSGPAVGPSRCRTAAVRSGVPSKRLRSMSSVDLAWADSGTAADRTTAAAEALIRTERVRMMTPMRNKPEPRRVGLNQAIVHSQAWARLQFAECRHVGACLAQSSAGHVDPMHRHRSPAARLARPTHAYAAHLREVSQGHGDRPSPCGLRPSSTKNAGAGREVVDHDAQALHALDRHALDGSDPRLPIGWCERTAHWSEATSDELLGSIGSLRGVSTVPGDGQDSDAAWGGGTMLTSTRCRRCDAG